MQRNLGKEAITYLRVKTIIKKLTLAAPLRMHSAKNWQTFSSIKR